MTERISSARTGSPGTLAGVIGWCLACCLALAALWVSARDARISALTTESERLHSVASQRAGQHDAHLTALSAIALDGSQQRPDLFREVAGAIMRFYPRITGVVLVPFDENQPTLYVGVWESEFDDLVREAGRRSTGAPVLVGHPAQRPAYIMVKRSPNTDAARYGLALAIDAAALLDGDSAYWDGRGTSRILSLPDGAPLLTMGESATVPQFSRALSSNTQRLVLATSVTLSPSDLLPLRRVVVVLMVITLATIALRAAVLQRAKVRAAEQRAELSGLETRLSHASRVNALGEMASGMAHELTQPLTAILAQTQAARHLARRGDTDRLVSALDNVVGQTRRASAILERLRTWTRPQDRRIEPFDLRDCVQVAKTLLAEQAATVNARLRDTLPATEVLILADRIELEQVLFNLVKNALDAVAEIEGAREVNILLTTSSTTADLDVRDSGPGIDANIRDRLFTPFVTTRENGTGLGLVLSQRLIERAGGDLIAVDVASGALFRISLPLAHIRQKAAQ